ncbi:MAG: NADH:flavin oxidoreductase/NADH oxidase family protein [Enterococcus lacertideformus]|uniref:NADH:flavin oxidoreductase/NADH oxidase family protein n=1 Tax=Enterococcus lacertideformus TaxID=2771493 RepID=A0A931AWP8_9ENTE|nr:NADH:flavin oxidoreductase/NADH oxidase family protein [Enterococcus lacertideformus]
MTKNILFQPLKLKNGVVLKNRFVKSAMSEVMGDEHYRPTEAIVNLYRNWAKGGTGLLITGNVMIDSTALGEKGNIVIENEHNLDILKRWAEAGQSNSAQTWVQLNHPGRQSPKHVSPEPVGPSAVALEGPNAFAFNKPRALTVVEIQAIIQRFANAAAIVKKAGFGGVEIHAAHGYLLSQFLSPISNVRTDQYGGSLENRMRIIVEVYQAMRAKVGEDYPIALKINSSDFRSGGFSEEDSIEVIHKMAKIGVDLIEISGGNYENTMVQGSNKQGAFFTDYAAKAKKGIDTPLIVTGGFRTLAGMEQAVLNHETDMVGLARAIALIPDLPNRAQQGIFKEINIEMLSTGIKSLDKKAGSYIGLSYYEMQMVRIAEDKPVKRTKNAWIPLWFAFKTQGLSMLLPQRA